MSLANEQNLTSKALALASSISSASTCVDTLLDLLERERDALSEGDIEAIDACGKQKADCVVELEHLDSQRANLCRELALESADIDQFLSDHQTHTAPRLWESFLTRLEQCKETNAVNGAFTRIRRSHVEKALHILRGSPERLGLYGPDGHDEQKSVSHLGRA